LRGGADGQRLSLAKQLLGKSALPDHGIERIWIDVIFSAVASHIDQFDLSVNNATIPSMACRAMSDAHESVRLYNFDKSIESAD
jgi:hypothetical protein